jgi:hypothetical protein
VDRLRWLVGTRRPILAGTSVGAFAGILAVVAPSLLVVLRKGEPIEEGVRGSSSRSSSERLGERSSESSSPWSCEGSS